MEVSDFQRLVHPDAQTDWTIGQIKEFNLMNEDELLKYEIEICEDVHTEAYEDLRAFYTMKKLYLDNCKTN